VSITLTSRDASGAIVTVPYTPENGSAPPADAAPDGQASGVLAAPPASPEAPQESAPETPREAPTPSVAGGDGASEGDEPDLDDTATPDTTRRRINQLTGRWRAEQRRHAETQQRYEGELLGLRGQVDVLTRLLQGQAPEPSPSPAPAGPPQRPRAEDFTDQGAYDQAMDTWLDTRTAYMMRQERQQSQVQQALIDREQAYRTAHPDYDAVVRQGLVGRTAPHVQQALMVLPEGPQLAYALARQPEVLQRLNTLPPPLMIAELARLVTPQAATPAPEPTPAAPETPPTPPAQTTPPTPLPEPMRPVGGTATSAPVGFDPSTASQAEFRAAYNRGWRPTPDQLRR
jgi:hypothetical protein